MITGRAVLSSSVGAEIPVSDVIYFIQAGADAAPQSQQIPPVDPQLYDPDTSEWDVAILELAAPAPAPAAPIAIAAPTERSLWDAATPPSRPAGATPPVSTPIRTICLIARVGLLAMTATLVVSAFPGLASAALVPTPPSHDFGTVDRYWQSPQQSFDFYNDQGLPVPVSTAISGPDSGSFSINGDGCQGKLLPDGSSCSLSVTVQPQAAGPLTASLDVDDGISVTSVPLSATASTGTLSVNPDPISFSPQPWFFGGQNNNFNIQSQGFGTRIDDVQIAGPDAGRGSPRHLGG